MKVAWEVEINSMSCIVWAETAARARYQAVKGYWAAFGRMRGVWPRAVAGRAALFDNVPAHLKDSGRCFSRDYVSSMT